VELEKQSARIAEEHKNIESRREQEAEQQKRARQMNGQRLEKERCERAEIERLLSAGGSVLEVSLQYRQHAAFIAACAEQRVKV